MNNTESGGQRWWDWGLPALHRHHLGTGRKDALNGKRCGNNAFGSQDSAFGFKTAALASKTAPLASKTPPSASKTMPYGVNRLIIDCINE